MTNTVLFIISGFWIGRILSNIFSYIHLWFVKEYRPDRMLIHIIKTRQGKWIYFPHVKFPPVSPKTVLLFLLLAGSEVWLFLALPVSPLLRLFLMDLLLFPVSFLFVILLRLPTVLFHRYQIQKATNLLRAHIWQSVIGITGSYGKTSTKEFLATILSGKYDVLKTEASKNSAIGIAETVLSGLTRDQSMFVVEMGAYKLGEIAEMCALVKPSIGIITALNAQHQDLFGTLETTMNAKYELLQGLTGKRIAIVNADIPYTHTIGEWAIKDRCDVWFVTENKKEHPEAAFWITDVASDASSCTFTLHYKDKKQTITAHIRGEHFIVNAALAVAAAVASGMPFSTACSFAKNIHSFHQVMEPSIGRNGEILINDTFNNNPEAALAALAYLAKFPKRKILVFQPMIELGSYTDMSHEQVGKQAGLVCDDMILTNGNFSDAFIRGVREADPEKHVRIFSPKQAARYINGLVTKGDAVLFKGKEAGFVLDELSKKN